MKLDPISNLISLLGLHVLRGNYIYEKTDINVQIRLLRMLLTDG